MKFEDVKVGMEVLCTDKNSCMYNKVGTVYKVLDYVIIVKYPEKTDTIYSATYNEEGLWGHYPRDLEPYKDPEEDLIVWGALGVGEHFRFNREDATECVKIASMAYVVLGYTSTYVFLGRTDYKVKIV